MPTSVTRLSFPKDLSSSGAVDDPTPDALLLADKGSLTSTPWFLDENTWAMHQSDQITACVTAVDLQPLIDVFREMLYTWVATGGNGFIHHRLYEHGMPTCLQDAFTTLAAYKAATPAMKGTVLQIAEERALSLVKQFAPTVGGRQGLLAHLARVLALFVYEFIRLFDGSVRLRASAEKQIGILRLWLNQMWETAKRYRGEDGYLSHRPLPYLTYDLDREYHATSDIWRLWIVTESVRRTHLIVNTMANTYRCMTEGYAACDGAAMLTARRGLWEAESAGAWFELAKQDTPLLLPALQPSAWMAQYTADDIDDFVQIYWRYVVGPDKMQHWVDQRRDNSIS